MSYFGHFAFPGKLLSGTIFCLFVFVMCAAGQAPGTAAPVLDSASLRTDGGMTTVTFSLAAGRIKVFLPDDIRSGDTISGMVVAEPAGGDEAEKAKNTGVLKSLTVYIDQKAVTAESGPKFTWLPKSPNPAAPSRYIIRISEMLPSQNAPAVYARLYPVGTASRPTYHIPGLGQSGRMVVITGPFDGNSDNTQCAVGGISCRIVAESPRQVLVQIPAEPAGQATLSIGEDKTTTSGPFRNIGVDLSAPKTSLMKGEKTTVGVQVTGLAGITNALTLQLVTTGAVNMDGGNTQTVQISPSQVGPDGKASLTRTITGIQPGPFNVTANVLQ
jgi:hypothetical protein